MSFSNQAPQTPLMRQYCEIKKQCPDAILFFRLGDFYEMFFEDAQVAAPILDIALTSRDKNAKNPIPLCGVPFHSAQSYITKLLDAGHKVAMCEQVEQPSAGKKIVRREIQRMITPATRSDQEGLASDQVNYVASLFSTKQGMTLVWVDIHEGKVEYAKDLSNVETSKLLQLIQPSEIVSFDPSFSTTFGQETETIHQPPSKDIRSAVLSRYGVNHESVLGIDSQDVLTGVYLLIEYVENINLTTIGQLEKPKHFEIDAYLGMDEVTKKNLDLFTQDAPSLMKVLNYTKSPGGARCLKNWISRPLTNAAMITSRLDRVEYLVNHFEVCHSLQQGLRSVRDIQRLMGRVVANKAFVRDLLAIRSTLEQMPAIIKTLTDTKEPNFLSMASEIVDLSKLCTKLQDALAAEPSMTLIEGGVIRDGYNQKLDQYRDLAKNNRSWIASLQEQERNKTSIPTLKIGYNKVFGYYLEVTKAHHDKVPAHYIRKQTLTNAERFITPELKEKEEEILSAKQKIIDLETDIFQSLVQACKDESQALMKNHSLLSEVDVLASLATAAVQHQYTRPEINASGTIDIKQGRHPVVEYSLSDTPFVPNDLLLDQNQSFILLTGPNMAGKSTVMRQAALIVLMAQMGCFVPASSANIGIVDQLFTRIGAQDDVTQGRSTFMVEMNETAHILQSATKKSLVLLDEIGRGTSTYDGVSIAWAVSSYLHDNVEAKTIFATHYHELVKMADTHKKLQCFKMQVRLWKDEIIFLRKMEPGSVERSYGIEVAQLAGVPMSVIENAKDVLANLESGTISKQETKASKVTSKSPLEKELDRLSPDELTPRQALDFVYRLKNKVQ